MPAGGFHDVGLSFVHQDLGLARPLTVLENLVGAAAREEYSRFRVDWRAEAAKARTMLESYGVTIDPRTVVNELPPVGQALVAIARAAEELREYRQRTGSTTSVLVLDEPTVFLPEEELQFLFDLIREVVAQGSSVIFISHDLAAVRTIADRVTVLRDGKVAATAASMADVSDEQIVEFIVGPAKSRELHEHGGQFHLDRVVDRSGAPQLVVSGLVGDRVRGLDFEVAPARSSGWPACSDRAPRRCPTCSSVPNGRPPGPARINGRDVDLTQHQPASAVGLGLSFIPADRNRDGIAREIEIDRNMMALVLRRFTAGGRLRNRRLRSTSVERAEEFDVRPRRTDVHASTLSGGNAQKVVLAKWLETQPAVLLLHEPTQGVDIAARAQIYRKIIAAADAGMSVVWVSSDFEELATTCTRVVGAQQRSRHLGDARPRADARDRSRRGSSPANKTPTRRPVRPTTTTRR